MLLRDRCCPGKEAWSEGLGPVPTPPLLSPGAGGSAWCPGSHGRTARLWCSALWKTTRNACFCFACFFPLVSYEQPIKRINSSGLLTGRLEDGPPGARLLARWGCGDLFGETLWTGWPGGEEGARKEERPRTQGDADSGFSPRTGPQAGKTREGNDQETLRRKGLSPFMPLLGTRAPGEGM